MNLKTAKYDIITPTLNRIGLSSPAAINLVAGIGLAESGYITRHQVDGPALGFWQMEPATEWDCWDNFISYRPSLAKLVDIVAYPDDPSSSLLVTNDNYAAAMCRVRLLRVPEPLPDADCAVALCAYWRKYYNTYLGKGEVDANHIALFQQAIEA